MCWLQGNIGSGLLFRPGRIIQFRPFGSRIARDLYAGIGVSAHDLQMTAVEGTMPAKL